MTDFSSKIAKAKKYINYIETQTSQFILIKNKFFKSINEEEKEISEKIEKISNNIHKAQVNMDQLIKELKLDITQNKNENEETDLRIKNNLFEAMIINFQHVIQKYQDEESSLKKIKEDKLIREAEIVLHEDLNEKQRREMIENPQMLKTIYANKLKGAAHVKLQNAVKDLEERHKDILKLQKSILELHKMILELSQLAQYQGEMIDNIVDNVSKAKDYVIKGEIEINKGHERMKKPFFKRIFNI